MSEKATVLVSEATKMREGEGDFGPWTLYHLIDGNEDRYSTFSDSLFTAAKALEGKHAEIEWEQTDKGKKFTSIKEATSGDGDTPKLGTGEYIKGQTAPSDARRMLIRGVQDNATAAADSYLKFQTSREITLKLYKATIESFLEFYWTDALRKSDLMEGRDIDFMPEYEGQ